VKATDSTERRRNWSKDDSGETWRGRGLWCAMYDSRPLEYANDPKGRAESAKRSKECWEEDGRSGGREPGDDGVTRILFSRFFAVLSFVSRSAISASTASKSISVIETW